MDKNKGKKKRPNPGAPIKQTTAKPNTAPIKVEQANEPWKPGVLLWMHLGIIMIFLLILRISLIDLPLERDESAYAYLGKRAIEGLAPYRDFYEMKPPFLFYGYGLLDLIFGYSHAGLRWGALFLTYLMCSGVYLIGRSFFGPKYGLIAALVLALFSANPYTTMVFEESELLVMALALYGIWFLCRLFQEKEDPRQERWCLIGAGLLIGSSVMVKQTAIFFLGFAAVVLILLAEGDNLRSGLGKLIQCGLWFSVGAITPVLLCLGIILGFGVWEEFSFWNLEYPNLYTQNAGENVGLSLLWSSVESLTQRQLLLWVLGGLGLLAIALKGLNKKRSIVLVALVFFSFLTLMPGKRYYPHYWIQFLPAVALLFAHLFFKLEKLGESPNLRIAKSLSFPLAGLFLFIGVVLSSPHWLKTDSNTLMREMFGGNPFVEDQLMARMIEAEIQPNQTVAVMGSEPQIYVYLNRKAPSRHFYTAFLSRPHRFIKAWHTEALDGLKSQKPDYVVFNILSMSWMLRPDSDQGFYQNSYSWVMENYTPIAYADYVDYYNPIIVTDAAASTYKPQSGEYVMLLKKK